jgi:hypothetical protein
LQSDGPDRHAAQCAREPERQDHGTLANGRLVAIVEYKDAANGRPWVKIVDYQTKRPIGWVFRVF